MDRKNETKKRAVDPEEWIFQQWYKESLKNPESTPNRMSVLTVTPKTALQIFTPARMKLAAQIQKRDFASVGELADHVNRPVEAVSRDLGILAFYGLVELKRRGKNKIPRIAKPIILVPLREEA